MIGLGWAMVYNTIIEKHNNAINNTNNNTNNNTINNTNNNDTKITN